ncbi:MAG: CcmD family protein [Labilithrix sp.]|nr:CcmD family protein [Labilithrix sp.]
MMHTSTTQPTADDRATEFQAVDGTGEQFSGYTLLVEAYAAIWLILFVWLVFIWRKQADLAARVEGLEGALTRAEQKATAGKSTPKKTAEAEEESTA